MNRYEDEHLWNRPDTPEGMFQLIKEHMRRLTLQDCADRAWEALCRGDGRAAWYWTEEWNARVHWWLGGGR